MLLKIQSRIQNYSKIFFWDLLKLTCYDCKSNMSDIFKFLTKDNLLYLVSWIYLKVRFLLECLLLILAKSLLNSLADLVIFPTTENSDVSRVSNFALDAKSSDKSFIYIY